MQGQAPVPDLNRFLRADTGVPRLRFPIIPCKILSQRLFFLFKMDSTNTIIPAETERILFIFCLRIKIIHFLILFQHSVLFPRHFFQVRLIMQKQVYFFFQRRLFPQQPFVFLNQSV